MDILNGDVSASAIDGKALQRKRKRKVRPSLKVARYDVESSVLGCKGAQESSTIDSNDCSRLKGLKKWIWEYRAKRPGIPVLQKQVDTFIAEYEVHEEQAKKEREAAAANDEGWTLVVNKGGRKKVTDSESGIKVGAVAISKAEKQNEKKKSNEQATLNFYRFQRREGRRNEVLELQKRFEEDKKRIAKMKAARKFRPF
ncbi:hypothetical protein O6H91_16G051700 [Diphasiastrum complanatum]|uniref:Uncharacterized protein n=1 Tax=Diphasiastrum complanatum TaxID=34168 RepID=A0ACC2BCB4_DIPCM|nr:hypothetical protein O6H91_16G051700 [Diphasiastrum complanatum]